MLINRIKERSGLTALNGFIIILGFLLLIYLAGYLLQFKAVKVEGITIVLLVLFFSLVMFSFGLLVVFLTPFFLRQRVLAEISLFVIFLGGLSIFAGYGTGSFKIVLIFTLPFVLLHLAVLAIYFSGRIRIPRTSPVRSDVSVVHDDRRRYIRFQDGATIEYAVGKEEWQPADVFDVSGGGVSLIIKEEIPGGTVVELKLQLRKDSRPIFATGRIAWSREVSPPGEGRFFAGAEFIKIDLSDRMRLISTYSYALAKKK